MKFKTIIFDLGGVCFSDSVQYFAMKIHDKYDIPPHKIYNIFMGELGTKYIKGEISLNDFWNVAKQQLKISESNDTLTELYLGGMRPINGTLEIIKELRKNGYQTLFLSDNVKDAIEYLQKQYNFTENFDDGIYSHQIGIRKPNPLLYQCLLKKTNNKPEDCIYIDDKPKYLEPAQELGMLTGQFVNPNSLREFLYFAGIDIDPYKKKM